MFAGDLTPNASPAATSYTLEDIYKRLSTNATATSGNHNLQPSSGPAATFYSLDAIYSLIPTINPERVFTGTSYLGVDGELTLACSTSSFDGSGNLIGNIYDGSGDGTNRWCITDSGDASASTILTGSTA